ncbi:TOPORS family protein [Megaselia abdita]
MESLEDIVAGGDIQVEIPVPATPSRLEDCPQSPPSSAVVDIDVECVNKFPDIPLNHGTTSEEDSGNENTTTINPRTRTRSGSPPPNCAICLSKCKDRCFTDSCLHQFCFKCLSEWSKVKAECPLCKQPFKSIIHNVKSMDDYDEYVVQVQPNTMPVFEGYLQNNMPSIAVYGTGRLQITSNGNGFFISDRPRSDTLSQLWRRYVYDRKLYALPLNDLHGRYRECTASFYRTNPAQITRLMPFINRELVFLLNNTEHQIGYVLEVIKEELTRSDIMSPEFRDRVDPYFRRRTSHFIHELYNFARSPYDMFGYDLVVRYRRRQPGQVTIELSTSDSDNDEPVIINDVPLSNLYVATSDVLPAAEAGTSSAAMDGQPPLHSNPSPPQTSSHSSNSNSNAPPPATTPAEPISLDSSSDDDCQFVLARKPPHLRTPEYVSLNSDSDSDVVFVQDDEPTKANESLNSSSTLNLNSSGNSAGTSGTAVSTNTLPFKKRRTISETHSTSSEDNKPLILHLNLKKNTAAAKRRQTRCRGASVGDSSTDCDEDQDWESKIKKTKIKSNRRKEVALHKYIKGAVNQGASTSSGFGVKTIYEKSSDSDSEAVRSTEEDDEDDDDEDMKPLKPNTINIKIIKNQNSFCSVVNEGGSPIKRKRKTSKSSRTGSSSSNGKKSSTKKIGPRSSKKKRNKQSSTTEEEGEGDADDDEDGAEGEDEESIDVVNRFDSTENSSNDSF